MKLYRNISLKELKTLINTGFVKGKKHKENEDSDYRSSLGPVLFFFKDAEDQTHLFPEYDFFIEVDIPENFIVGEGEARYISTPPCDCCKPFTVIHKEVYVSEYRAEHIIHINSENFFIEDLVDRDMLSDFSIYLVWEGHLQEFFDQQNNEEQIKILRQLDENVIKEFIDYEIIAADNKADFVNNLLDIKFIFSKINNLETV